MPSDRHTEGDHRSWAPVVAALVVFTTYGSFIGLLVYMALPSGWPLWVVAPIIIVAGIGGGWLLNWAWISALNTALEGLAEHAE